MPVRRGLWFNGVSSKLLNGWWGLPLGYLYPSGSFLRNFLPKFKQAVKKQPIFSKGLGALIRG
jgi:hypothetical protein